MASAYPPPENYLQKRGKSSVLKTFMHKRTPSAGEALPSPTDYFIASPAYEHGPNLPFLPSDHQHHNRALGELQQNQQTQAPPSSPKKSKDAKRPTTSEDGSYKSLHKKTLSSISLKSLSGKDSDKQSKSKDPKPDKPKKVKSSANLATLLSRPKSSKSLKKQAEEEATRAVKDKENRSPQLSSPAQESRPPIYAQFSSDAFTKQPLGGKFLEDQIDLYTPEQYSPGKQRNFYEGQGTQPSLARRDESQRPKSTYLPSSFSIQDISRKNSKESRRSSAEITRKVSRENRPSFERKTATPSAKSDKTAPNRGQRALAALSGLGNGRSKGTESPADVTLNDKDINRAFEAMLERRNIPENHRAKMRGLDMAVKKDFVRQDLEETTAAKKGNHGSQSSNSSADTTSGSYDVPEVKSKRPRSRTFTLSRGSSKEPPSPTKKTKPEGTMSRHGRKQSSESVKGELKSPTTGAAAVAQTLIAKAKGQLPDDFVSYLRKNPKPELVEVGRLHKLRLLLRNETVAWTDEFIGQGGMEETVGLLHRIMEVEWREEHEDALLHEVLLCLKALATTDLALQHLNKIQVTLFPALLHMIFDEEKKGPSEFTTRNIISSLLFTWLKSAPIPDRTLRAKTLLSYLRNQEPSESQRPVDFVLDMRRPRPYTIWCKEVTNVTKEVFWIFLHNLNVVPLPKPTDNLRYDHNTSTVSSNNSVTSFDSCNPYYVYMSKNFPQELPPVPAAPYVGGVEWDATNYLASHLDLVNGIIACLPTQAERNILRDQMRISGWEKCMGATLRLCKEKFYGGVHAGLRCWVAAAAEDGWDTRDVRCGPSVEAPKSPRKSPKKAAPMQEAPKIEMKLSFGENSRPSREIVGGDGWL